MTARDRVLALLPDEADGVVLASPEVVSWYFDGARTAVPLGGSSVVVVLVGRGEDRVRAHLMEAERLTVEEGIAGVAPVDWTQPLVPEEWSRDPRILSESDLAEELRAARAPLTDVEVDRYRALGTEVAAAMTAVAMTVRPATAERAVAGELAERLYALGAEPVVLLAAGAARSGYRHPLPTAAPLGDRAMLVVGARRHGLIVNLTRWVQFAGPENPLESGIRAVEADVLDATQPGASLSRVFEVLRASYLAHGFGEDEWRQHHQGGPTGYFGRDPKVIPHTLGRVTEHQAFAWNPSAPGVKVEDTVLTTSRGVEVLTFDPAWPSTEVAVRQRPLTLQS
jgi:Xaa-Pro aminopeptidase